MWKILDFDVEIHEIEMAIIGIIMWEIKKKKERKLGGETHENWGVCSEQ